MPEKIPLKNAILVNGQPLGEVTADFEALTTQDFMQAGGEASAAAAAAQGVSLGTEFDPSFHLALGFRAIVRGTPGLSLLDAKRITGSDLMRVQRAARTFCLTSLSEV